MVLHKRRRMGEDGSTHAAHHFACHLQDEDEKLKIKHEDEDEDEDEDGSSGANYKILDQYLDPKKKQENDKQIGKLKSQIKDQFRKANLTASFKKVFEVFALSLSRVL